MAADVRGEIEGTDRERDGDATPGLDSRRRGS